MADNTDYNEENKRRNKAIRKENKALKEEVINNDQDADSTSAKQNRQSNTEKGIEENT